MTATGSFTAVSRFDTVKLMAECAKGPVSTININGTFIFR